MAILRERTVWKKSAKTQTPRSTDLNAEEQENLRAALRVLVIRYRSWNRLAQAMGVLPRTVQKGSHRCGKPGAGLALRAARVAGTTVEEILAGKWPVPGACPYCGRGGE